MNEITWIIDRLTGALLVRGLTADEAPRLVGDLLPVAREMGCALPPAILAPPPASPGEISSGPCLRIAGYYHNSLVEGPGRRSSLLVSGCELACRGCRVAFLHPIEVGTLVPVDRLADVLLDPAVDRDGISLLGGEPTGQPEGLLALVRALRSRACRHILCYSGYTYEALRKRARHQPAIGAILDEIDVLVDGPYVKALSHAAGPWTGSGNQRVIDLQRTRQTGQVALLEDDWLDHDPRP